jgi:hypothetical protein
VSKTAAPVKKRPSWLLPVIVIVVVAAIGAVAALVLSNRPTSSYTAEVSGAPRAVVDQTVVDHGAVPFEQMVESAFVVQNVGDEPLVILGEPRVELVQGC